MREALGDSVHHSFAGSFRWSFGLKPLDVHDTFFVLKKIAIMKQAIFTKTELCNVYCE